MGKQSHLVYLMLRKFSVASESRREMVSALLAFEWIKMQTVIDFQVDMYTFWLFGLISANLIRLRENPAYLLLPLHWPVFLFLW